MCLSRDFGGEREEGGKERRKRVSEFPRGRTSNFKEKKKVKKKSKHEVTKEVVKRITHPCSSSKPVPHQLRRSNCQTNTKRTSESCENQKKNSKNKPPTSWGRRNNGEREGPSKNTDRIPRKKLTQTAIPTTCQTKKKKKKGHQFRTPFFHSSFLFDSKRCVAMP